jgi:hypothetical protein
VKLSVSVPDHLWAEVAKEGDSPSEVVQEALRMLQRSRRPAETFGRAPSDEFKRAVEAELVKALDQIRTTRRRNREAGYRGGIELVNHGLLDDHDTFRLLAERMDVEEAAHELNYAWPVDGLLQAICDVASEFAGLGVSREEGEGCGVDLDFMIGFSQALHDLWEASGLDTEEGSE